MKKFIPHKIINLEISKEINGISGLDNYGYAQIMLRYFGEPLGFVKAPIVNGSVSAGTIYGKLSGLTSNMFISRLRWFLSHGNNNSGALDDILSAEPSYRKELFITVAVCTRNRTSDLELCLRSIEKLKYSNYEVVVVDNAPSNNSTELLVKNNFSKFRYLREPVPGVDNARNLALLESKGEIIAYADDDVIVDELWLRALSERFQESDDICAVTGLVVPYEMETESQYLFERYGGFSRGFKRIYAAADPSLKKIAMEFAGSGKYGTGANMAFRKSIFEKIGLFDPALDVGTPTNGGGDLEMFFRVIKEGYTLVYDPCAIIWHRHRREYSQLKFQLSNNGIGFYSYLVRTGVYYKDERLPLLKLGLIWFWSWNVKRFLISLVRPNRFPRDIIWGELIGVFKGLFRYFISQRKAQIKFKKITAANSDKNLILPGIFVTEFEITDSTISFPETRNYTASKFFILHNRKLIGSLEINNRGKEVNREWLIYETALQLNVKFLDINKGHIAEETIWELALNKTKESLKLAGHEAPRLHKRPAASVVIATLDRPDDLKECLKTLKHAVGNNTEIIVVDNNPSSGLTPKALKEFDGIILINEERKGLSYARNKGFLRATGDISIALDDDVIVPEGWLENLLEPFENPIVSAVTGNVLPYSLDLEPQKLFETYGGLGKGFRSKEAGEEWFQMFRYKAVPTWTLGATANAAFRTSIFRNEDIGLLHEALGAGTPSGCSEDTYLFYKILKAGFNIVYNPKAYVRHKHRATIKAFRKQLYNYSKGHVAYNLMTAFKDNDFRGLTRIFVELPLAHLYRIYFRLRRRDTYPIRYVLLEAVGNLAGPFALIRSLARMKKLNKLYNNQGVVSQAYAAKSKGVVKLAAPNIKELSATQTEIQ